MTTSPDHSRHSGRQVGWKSGPVTHLPMCLWVPSNARINGHGRLKLARPFDPKEHFPRICFAWYIYTSMSVYLFKIWLCGYSWLMPGFFSLNFAWLEWKLQLFCLLLSCRAKCYHACVVGMPTSNGYGWHPVLVMGQGHELVLPVPAQASDPILTPLSCYSIVKRVGMS